MAEVRHAGDDLSSWQNSTQDVAFLPPGRWQQRSRLARTGLARRSTQAQSHRIAGIACHGVQVRVAGRALDWTNEQEV